MADGLVTKEQLSLLSSQLALQASPFLTIVLMVIRSFRMDATRATLCGFPFEINLW